MRIAIALLAAIAATPALAADPDAPVSTARASAPPMSTADQIDAFIRTSPAREVRRDAMTADDGVVSGEDDGKPHGEIAVGVGTGGYRSVYGRTEFPVGKSGRVSLAFENTRNGYGYGRGWYDGPYAGPLALGGPDRQRCALEGMTPERSLDTLGGPNGRCARPLNGW